MVLGPFAETATIYTTSRGAKGEAAAAAAPPAAVVEGAAPAEGTSAAGAGPWKLDPSTSIKQFKRFEWFEPKTAV